jgi:RNA polymerase sigma factor (sigma-70 family)
MSYRDVRKAEKRLQDAEARLAKRGKLPDPFDLDRTRVLRRNAGRRLEHVSYRQNYREVHAKLEADLRASGRAVPDWVARRARGEESPDWRDIDWRDDWLPPLDGRVLADAYNTDFWRERGVDIGTVNPAIGHNRVVTPEEHQLVLDHMKIVHKWAGKYARKTRGTVYDDLVALGMDVLYEQLPRWDRTRGVKFGAFVKWRVKGEMVNYLERDRDRKNLSIGGTPSDPQPGDDDLGQARGWAREAWKSEADDKRYRGKKPKPGPSSYAAAASWRERSPDRNYFEREPGVSLAEAVERALEALTEKQREVYRARVLEHPPVEVSVLAKRMGVIERRIRALEARAREIVSDRLKEIGK